MSCCAKPPAETRDASPNARGARARGMKPSPSPSGTGGSGADPAAAYPARDLAQSLSAFANINFQAEKDMLENAGAHPFPDPRARSRSRLGRRRPTRASRSRVSLRVTFLFARDPPDVGRGPPDAPPCSRPRPGLTPTGKPLVAVPRRASPARRRVLGDVANRDARARREGGAAKPSEPWNDDDDFAAADATSPGRSLSPSAAITERASAPPKSPAEELAARAALAAASLRRVSGSSQPDYAAHTTPSPASSDGARLAIASNPSRRRASSSSSGGSKMSSAERARRMAKHADRTYDSPAPSDGADAALDALESELGGADLTPTVAALETLALAALEDLADEPPSPAFSFAPAATAVDPAEDPNAVAPPSPSPPMPLHSPSALASPFVRLVAVDVADEDEDDAPGASAPGGNGNGNGNGNGSGSGSNAGSNAGAVNGASGPSGGPSGGSSSFGGFGGFGGFGRGSDSDDARGSGSPPRPSGSGSSSPPAGPSPSPRSRRAVRLANALGLWRESVNVAAVRAEAERTREDLTGILREQAASCDDEVNQLSDERDLLTSALAESERDRVKLRWRWAARAGLLAQKADGYRAEARRLRAKARRLEGQLLKVEEHITSAAADFDRLRGRLTESTRETDRARASEARAREQLAEAQSAANAAQSAAEKANARADALDKAASYAIARSPLRNASNVTNAEAEADPKSPMRAAIRAELRDDARAKIRAELRAEMRAELRAELGEELRAEAEAEAAAETAEATRRRIEAGAASGTVAACIDALLRDARGAQMRQVASARRAATERARQNLVAAAEAGIETLRLGTAPSEGGVDPLELVSLIAVHALERCEAHPHGDGERAFYRAARRVELAARACQPDYKQTPGSGTKLRGGLGLRREDDSPPGVTPRS
jgi:hypothetical protein